MLYIKKAEAKPDIHTRAILFTDMNNTAYQNHGITDAQIAIIEKLRAVKKNIIALHEGESTLFACFCESKADTDSTLEALRKCGATLSMDLRGLKAKEVLIDCDNCSAEMFMSFCEGLALASYHYAGFKKNDKAEAELECILVSKADVDQGLIDSFNALIAGTYIARDLVNTPYSQLNAEQLADKALSITQSVGCKAEILGRQKIEALKMGGLLSVAAGSIDPPTFTIIEWNPGNAINKKPIVLVGKGVVFDTGGLTLKPTPGSMDMMKTDMAGAAAVVGCMYTLARSKTPVHVIGLIPATDNRPGERATAPGDVIYMYDGTSVEVMNTDAEGRLILADALSYAKKYDPDLVLDLATLTGAAAKAIGQFGIVFMGTADDKTKSQLQESGRRTYERLVEFPLWDEYGEMIKSDIADLKNVAVGVSAGAITAGKFLQYFTEYPWIHMDIAGPAYISGTDSYRGKNATGIGVRLLYDFIKNKYLS